MTDIEEPTEEEEIYHPRADKFKMTESAEKKEGDEKAEPISSIKQKYGNFIFESYQTEKQ